MGTQGEQEETRWGHKESRRRRDGDTRRAGGDEMGTQGEQEETRWGHKESRRRRDGTQGEQEEARQRGARAGPSERPAKSVAGSKQEKTPGSSWWP